MTRSRSAKDYTPRDQYYTPQYIFDALGMTFDIDVCSPPNGVNWIPAINYFDEERDGLAQPWQGNVWMNPPYSTPKLWIEKFVQHNAGVALIAVSRSNAFFSLWNNPAAKLMVPRKSVMFVTPEGKKAGIFMPVILVALGDQCIKALERSGLGYVR